MTEHHVVVRLAVWEAQHLAKLVDDFCDLMRERDTADPAVSRLTPSAYPDDRRAQESFSASTRDDLLDRRLSDARNVLHRLEPLAEEGRSLIDDEAVASREVRLAPRELDAWLRTLAAIRLVIAERLGIASDDDSAAVGADDLFDWLGYRLELLIQTADEADEADGR